MKIYYYNFYRGIDEIKIRTFNSQDLEFKVDETCRFSINSFNKPVVGGFVSFKKLSDKETKVASEAAKNVLIRVLR